MDVAPPPASEVRLQEVDDRLVVRFRPRRSGLVFLTVWLAGWTFFGVLAAGQVPKADPGDGAFLVFWLCGWFFGECLVIGVIAWQLFGRELVEVTRVELVDRKKLGRFARVRSYDASDIRDVTAERVPHDEDERPRKDFCLRLTTYDGAVARVGEVMGEREAEWGASVVLARIRTRSWWSDEDDAGSHHAYGSGRAPQAVLEAGRLQIAQPSAAKAWLWAAGTIGCVTLAGTLLVTTFGRSQTQEAPIHSTSVGVEAQGFQPSREDFRNARDYAEAMTSYALMSGRTEVVGHPRCGARTTWTHWSCHVPAKPAIGPLAGGTLQYRCAAADTGGSSTGVICRPDPRVGPTAATTGTAVAGGATPEYVK